MNFLKKIIVAFLFLMFSASAATAYMAPPAKLVDVKVTPACVKVQTDRLDISWRGIFYYEKWAAVQILNDCDTDIILTQVKTLLDSDGKPKFAPIVARRTIMKNDRRYDTDFAFGENDALCDEARSIAEKEIAAHKHPSERYQVAWACKEITIPAKGYLILPALYDTSFAVKGHTDASFFEHDVDVQITGGMVNPREQK